MRDLVVHTASAHRWAMMFLRADADSTERFLPDMSDAPDDGALPGWYEGIVGELVDELGRHDPDEPKRSFAGRSTASFWMRRMTQETSIHRWDLQNSLPDGAVPIDPAVAAEGITELAQLQIPLILRRRNLPDGLVGKVLAISATDHGDEWVLRLRADGVDAVTGEDALGAADLTMRGAASDLDLVLWRRVPADTVDLRGDCAVLDGLLDVVVI